MMLEKHIWICAFMLAGVKNGGVPIGSVERDHAADVTALIAELLASCRLAAPDVPFDPTETVTARLLAYARSVAHFPTALKELPWRNGYFWDLSQAAMAAGKPDPSPTPTKWLLTHGPPLPAPAPPASSSKKPQYAVLFDCDGVIVETEELHRLAYNGAFRHFDLRVGGEPVEWTVPYYDKLQNTVGGGKPKMRWHFGQVGWPTYATGAGPQPAPSAAEAQGWLIDALQDQKTVLYKKLVVEVATARPGVLELMDEGLGRDDVAVGICSAATKAGFEQVVRSVVKPARLARLDIVKAGDDVERKKPDPMIYNLARQLLGLPADRCVVIEDSLVGLRAAKAAGMRCVVTYTASTKDQDFFAEGADAVVGDLSGVTIDSLLTAVFSGRKVRDLRPTAPAPVSAS
jgi:beta-phosphoglucomutase-like phosphatase (HAD superfamily)